MKRLARDAELKRRVERDLEEGFKWYKNNTTDGNTSGRFSVNIDAARGRVVVTHHSRRWFLNPGGSVMSRSVGVATKVVYNGRVGEFYPFVHVKKVMHFDWDGRLAAEF